MKIGSIILKKILFQLFQTFSLFSLLIEHLVNYSTIFKYFLYYLLTSISKLILFFDIHKLFQNNNFNSLLFSCDNNNMVFNQPHPESSLFPHLLADFVEFFKRWSQRNALAWTLIDKFPYFPRWIDYRDFQLKSSWFNNK